MKIFRSLFLSLLLSSSLFAAPHVALNDLGLRIDGKEAEFWFGAEVQYFRARGGATRNVPREKVLALWNKLIDRILEAKMNAVGIYVPWDFHEPVAGTFDFEGTLDLDKDGKADYPSRDLKTFLKLLTDRGIKKIMIRPGPYINAEWGPTGFGAIPLWFLEKYPEALAKTKTAGKPRTATFSHPTYRAHVEKWFSALYSNVLKPYIGPNKPIVFLQLDNETNYFWDSLYERDYSDVAVSQYQRAVKEKYTSIEKLNAAYGSKFVNFKDVAPPASDKDTGSSAWHYDWFWHHDVEIRSYYQFLRSTWEKLGVNEPDVLFTSCDSFNAFANGLLPRLDYRQQNRLSLTTMNIYPKTSGTQLESTSNEPMKAAHDATLIASSHRQFYGNGGNWVMSTETVGGWFPPTEVSLATRQHAYGSLLGSGVKAITIYYFHEGFNWDGLEKTDSELQFDAPLDKDMNPRPAFSLLKNLGESLALGLGASSLESVRANSQILLAHETEAQYPLPGQPDAVSVGSTQSAGLFGMLREAGYLPEVSFLDYLSQKEISAFKLIVWNSPGYLSVASQQKLEKYLSTGGNLLWIGPKAAWTAKYPKVSYWAQNLGKDWNTDNYLKLDVVVKLNQLKKLLSAVGATPGVEINTDDKLPFVHVWTRPSSDGKKTLLVIENFLRTDRSLKIKLTGMGSPKAAKYHLKSLWSANTDQKVSKEIAKDDLIAGLPFTIESDSVAIYSLEGLP